MPGLILLALAFNSGRGETTHLKQEKNIFYFRPNEKFDTPQNNNSIKILMFRIIFTLSNANQGVL